MYLKPPILRRAQNGHKTPKRLTVERVRKENASTMRKEEGFWIDQMAHRRVLPIFAASGKFDEAFRFYRSLTPKQQDEIFAHARGGILLQYPKLAAPVETARRLLDVIPKMRRENQGPARHFAN